MKSLRKFLRPLALLGAIYLMYRLFQGSGINAEERAVFWVSSTAVVLGACGAWFMGRRTPYWITVSGVSGVLLVAFVGTLVVFGGPPLLRFGNALALSIGNAVTIGLATWLAASAVLDTR